MYSKNNEGYHDPTAAGAIRAADKLPPKVSRLIYLFREIADAMGFELKGHVWLRDKETGKEYK